MADIWYQNTDVSTAWHPLPVPDDGRYVQIDLLRNSAEPRLRIRQRLHTARSQHNCSGGLRFLLVRTGTARTERWFAVSGPDVPLLINGRAVLTGLSALEDRDLLSFAADSRELAFTTQRAAQVEPFNGGADTFCPRCKLSLETGQSVVTCPGCGTVHHQDEQIDLPCWTYAGSCVHCDFPTDLEAPAFRWTPDDL